MSNTLSIRATEEIQKRFKQFADESEAENNGDFLDKILTIYEAQKAKENVAVLKPAIDAVEKMTGQLLNILNGAAETILVNDDKYASEIDEQRIRHETKIEKLNELLHAAEELNSEKDDIISRLEAELKDIKEKLEVYEWVKSRIKQEEKTEETSKIKKSSKVKKDDK